MVSRQVGEKGPYSMLPPDSLHPTQGSLPCGKLDAQPPLQLLATFSRLAILPITEPGAYEGVRAADVPAVDAVRRGAVVFAPRSDMCGLATCFGASTVTGGIVAAEPVGICDAAGAHSKIVDKAATAEGTTRLDENLMTMSFQIRDGNSARQVHGNIHFEAGNRGLMKRLRMTHRAELSSRAPDAAQQCVRDTRGRAK
jgi:hypothetical protein